MVFIVWKDTGTIISYKDRETAIQQLNAVGVEKAKVIIDGVELSPVITSSPTVTSFKVK